VILHRLQVRGRALSRQFAQLHPTTQGLLWTSAAGLMFCVLNALMRAIALQLDPFQTQFLRYLFGLFVLLPWVWRRGLLAFKPKQVGGQFARGAVHTFGLCLWFLALPKIPLADTTAIGFTTPLFIMFGAALFFHEPMRWDRWLAALVGFGGVLVVVAPKLSGSGDWSHLIMLASAPMFAASFLITKALTRYERAEVIVLWQALTVTAFSVPLALLHWQAPSAWQWLGFLVCGGLGSAAHYCLTRSFGIADISATQSVKFLDLVWSAVIGWLIFSDIPLQSTLIGGVVIAAATVWIARRESRAQSRPRPPAT
jgi:drug/metabolite transporter (DMT)-like permease